MEDRLGVANTTTGYVLKKKETTGVLTSGHGTGQPRKTTALEDRNITRPVKKNPETTVGDITDKPPSLDRGEGLTII